MADNPFAEVFSNTSKNYPFPNTGKNKDDNYLLQYCEAIYSEYVKDRGGMPYSRRFDFNLFRLYGEGNQPTEKYMDILCPYEKDDQGRQKKTREGWMNISWDILSVAPKFRRIFVGMFEKIEHDVSVSAINDKALSEKEDYKWNLWATKQLQEFFETQDAKAGIETSQPEWLPDTIMELEMFMNESFKLKTEMAMEMGIDYAFYLSDWNEIKKRMLYDAFDYGVMFCEDYVDPVDKKIKCRYLDPRRVIIRYSNDPHFKNIDYWGYMETMTISELRAKTQWDEDKIISIAKQYAGFGDNIGDFDWTDYYNLTSAPFNNSNTLLPYDNWQVDVLRTQFITSNTELYKIKTKKDGSRETYIDGTNENAKAKNDTDTKTYEQHKYQVSMDGYWVVGTKEVFGFGKSYIQPREQSKWPKLSINGYKYSNKSIMASIIPNLDSFQLSWLKLQNAKVMAAPAGLDIQVGALENIDMGDGKMKPLQILALRRQTGDLLYSLTTHHSEINQGGQAPPVSEREGGIGRQLDEFIKAMEYDINLIRSITGISEVMDATAPEPRTAVGTSQMSMEASSNSLQPIYSGYVSIKESTAKKMVTRYQTLAAQGDIKIYYPSLGSNVMQVFTLTSDVTHEEYALKIKMRPTDEMKQAVRQAALEAVKLGIKQGGISHGDYLYIEDKIQNGNLKYARLYLSYKEKVYAEQAQKLQAANMQQNQQGMMAQEQAKEQAKGKEMQAQVAGDIALQDKKHKDLMEEEQLRHDNKMKEIAQTSMGKGLNIRTKGMVDADLKEHEPAEK